MEQKQDLYRQRLDKLARIRETKEEPFKYSYPRTHTIEEAYEEHEKRDGDEGLRVRLAGRLLAGL